MIFQEQKIANLKCLVFPGKSDQSISLFHGYGASMEDLAPLSEYIRQVCQATLYFPNAPLDLSLSLGFYGYAWFPIDFAEIEALQREGKVRDLSKALPKGFGLAREYVDAFYQEILQRHEKNVVGGFSQGAMLATDLALRSKKAPNGLLILSGTLVVEEEWKKLAKEKSPLSFFQSHGFTDPILPFPLAKRLYDLLIEAGHKGQFLQFSGGHEIPQPVLQGLLQYISTVFNEKPIHYNN